MAHGHVLKKAVHYQVGYFQNDGENAAGSQADVSGPNRCRPMPATTGHGWSRDRRAVPRGRHQGHAQDAGGRGSPLVSTDVPEGPNHLQGQSITGYNFFPRQYLTSGTPVQTGPGVRLDARVRWE